MCDVSRRDFLYVAATTAAAALYEGARTPEARALAEQQATPDRATSTAGATAQLGGTQAGSAPGYDLVIKGGEVLDPSQGLRGTRDVGIWHGRIAALATDIPAEQAAQVLVASGKLVVPGLVDLHAHVGPAVRGPGGLVWDELVHATGVTTVVSAGDAGANTFLAFDRLVVGQSRTRTLGFLHIAQAGLATAPWEMFDIRQANVEQAAQTVAENADVLLGLKVRQTASVVGDNGLEPLRRAIAAAEMSGTGARVMCHIGNVPGDLSDLLDLLRPGDILTHAYSGGGNDVVRDGRLLPAAREAQTRGVVIDVGHGALSFDYTVAEAAIAEGLTPDVISSDLHGVSINTPGMPYLPWVMSKFLNLGFPLEQVIAMATINPATVIGRVADLGTLRIGAPADVTILELVDQPVAFIDGSPRANRRAGQRFLRVADTVRAGRPIRRPYPAPLTPESQPAETR